MFADPYVTSYDGFLTMEINGEDLTVILVDGMKLRLKRVGVDTHRENIAFLACDDLTSRALGLHPGDRIEILANERSLVAVLDIVEGSIMPVGKIGLSSAAFDKLGVSDNSIVDVAPAEPPASLDLIRNKMNGRQLTSHDYGGIVNDMVRGRYSKVDLTALVVSATINGLTDDEIMSLTKAMIENGDQLKFDSAIVADKHSVGGVPGNRTTPIITSIVAAAGLLIPKTSSRSVTSPAGTADTVETLMNVELRAEDIYDVVSKENGCLVWGGAVNLAPADDLIIQIEHALNIDAQSLMISSILAKKKAAGATHVLLDIPVGHGTKAETTEIGERLKQKFQQLGFRLGLNIRVLLTDGSQPIGNGIGPSLEAKDVIKVLANDPEAPVDLRDKSLCLAGELFELTRMCTSGQGRSLAHGILASGKALDKFEKIRKLQGRHEIPSLGSHSLDVPAENCGHVRRIDNRIISRTAQLAGAPQNPGTGVYLAKHVNDFLDQGQLLLRIYAESDEALTFAKQYWAENVGAAIIIS
jgi:thymidine phosphorylase